MTNKANVWERMTKSRNREEFWLFCALKCHYLSEVQLHKSTWVVANTSSFLDYAETIR